MNATDTIWMIVGLGNPGKEYERTRHNAGFIVLDSLLSSIERTTQFHLEKRFSSLLAEVRSGPLKIFLVKPQTFMNRSGAALQALSQFYKINPDRIVVIHDELDIPLGDLKLKQGGGSGGHNGIKSIDSELGSVDYFRIRVGIGKPLQAGGDQPVVRHVLEPFGKSESAVLAEVADRAARAALMICSDGLAAAHRHLSAEKSKKIKAAK